MKAAPPRSSQESPADAGVEPLRVDGTLRAYLARDPSPQRRVELARALLAHQAAEEALELLPEAGADALRWAALRQLGAGRPELDVADLKARGEGRDAFVVALHAGEEAAAEDIAARTPAPLGPMLRAELAMRRGGTPEGALDPLNALRRDFLRGDLARVAARAAGVEGEDRAEALILGACAHRRLGDLRQARSLLDALPGGRVMPGAALERTLLRLEKRTVLLLGASDLSAVPWALGLRPGYRTGWLGQRRMRSEMARFERSLGPFRGELLTRCVAGRVAPVTQAEAPRARAARLRAGIRVQPLETVLARLDALAERAGDVLLTPMYAAELLHWFGRHEEAGARCEQVTRADPYSRWSWIGLVQAQMWGGEIQVARRTLKTLRRRHPRLPTLPAVAGELALAEGRPKRALPLLERAVQDHPTRWSAHVLLALALLRAGQTEAAGRLHARLRALAPGAWPSQGGVEAQLSAHLTSLRGNRSSSVVSFLAPDGAERLIRREALSQLAQGS